MGLRNEKADTQGKALAVLVVAMILTRILPAPRRRCRAFHPWQVQRAEMPAAVALSWTCEAAGGSLAMVAVAGSLDDFPRL